MIRNRLHATWLLLPIALSGCSIKQVAVNRIGDALANGGSAYATDNDIDLVRDAFTLDIPACSEHYPVAGWLLARSKGPGSPQL